MNIDRLFDFDTAMRQDPRYYLLIALIIGSTVVFATVRARRRLAAARKVRAGLDGNRPTHDLGDDE